MKLVIADAAREVPDRPCLVTSHGTLSYAEMSERVGHASAWLRSNGIEPRATPEAREPFALTARPELRDVELVLALFELGVPALLLHPRWTPAERTRVLDRLALSERSVPDSFAANSASSRPARAHDPESPLAILCTSGSSGDPKGVVLSRRAFAASAAASAEVLGWFPNDRWLLGLPLAHVGGLSILTRCLSARRTIVLPDASPPGAPFDPEALLHQIERDHVTLLSLVPIQLAALLDLGSRRPSLRRPPALRGVLLGGAAAPRTLLERARTAGWPIHCTYGLTEACSHVTLQREPWSGSHLAGSGEALPGVDVRLGPDDRIAIRSRTLLSAYFPDVGPVLDADGWFTTEDCGRWVEGQLELLGRADDVLVTGGENVHPLEIEHQLREHPGIREVCVFGLPDERWGQIVAAAVVPEPASSLEDLAEFCRRRLASFKRPRRIALVDALPVGSSGKIERRRARELFGERCTPL